MTMRSADDRRVLPHGTAVEYQGVQATVTADAGGQSFSVNCAGQQQWWSWNDDVRVVKYPFGAPAYATFDQYVNDFPEAERFRRWWTNEGHCECLAFKLEDNGSPHGGAPDNYMGLSIHLGPDHIRLAAMDCDDGLMVRDFTPNEMSKARELLSEMMALAPFSMYDAAEVFGFTWE